MDACFMWDNVSGHVEVKKPWREKSKESALPLAWSLLNTSGVQEISHFCFLHVNLSLTPGLY